MSAIKHTEVGEFAERLVNDANGFTRAAKMIRKLAFLLSEKAACDDLKNAAADCQQMLSRAWENRCQSLQDKLDEKP